MKTINKKISLFILATIIGLAACKKEEQTVDPVVPTPAVPSAEAELQAFFQTNRENMKQSFTIDVASPILITGTQGTTIQFNTNTFETQSGVAVTGNVDVKLIEIYKKADMVFANAQTMGNYWGGGIEPLVSGGEFFVEVFQNGNPLKLKQNHTFSMTAPAPGGTVSQMNLFYGDESRGNDTLVWEPADSARFQGTGSMYAFFPDSLRWINCDYFYSNPNPKTNLSALIPAGYTNKTCKVLVSFNGLNSVTSFYNYNAGVLSSFAPYKLPIGLGVNLIAVSKINGTTYASITPATVASGLQVTLNPLVATTDAQLKIDINALP